VFQPLPDFGGELLGLQLLDNIQGPIVPQAGEEGLAAGTGSQTVDENAGAKRNLIGVRRFEQAGLEGGQFAELDQGIQPDGVERGQVASQPFDPVSAAAQISPGAERELQQQLLQVGGKRLEHASDILVEVFL
jgi:hypothetical protein